MRAILIDPEQISITEIDTPNFEAMRDYIDSFVDTFTVGPNLGCMVDDEGLLKTEQHYWSFIGTTSGFAGKSVIYATDNMGDLAPLPAFMTTAKVMDVVAFLGGPDGFERAIQRGIVERPSSRIQTPMPDGSIKTEILWEWHPPQKEERA